MDAKSERIYNASKANPRFVKEIQLDGCGYDCDDNDNDNDNDNRGGSQKNLDLLLTPGWILHIHETTGENSNRKRIYRFWFSPKTKRRFRSRVEVRKFITILKEVGSENEDDAWKKFMKGKVGGRKRRKATYTRTLRGNKRNRRKNGVSLTSSSPSSATRNEDKAQEQQHQENEENNEKSDLISSKVQFDPTSLSSPTSEIVVPTHVSDNERNEEIASASDYSPSSRSSGCSSNNNNNNNNNSPSEDRSERALIKDHSFSKVDIANDDMNMNIPISRDNHVNFLSPFASSISSSSSSSSFPSSSDIRHRKVMIEETRKELVMLLRKRQELLGHEHKRDMRCIKIKSNIDSLDDELMELILFGVNRERETTNRNSSYYHGGKNNMTMNIPPSCDLTTSTWI